MTGLTRDPIAFDLGGDFAGDMPRAAPEVRLWWALLVFAALLRTVIMPYGGFPTDIGTFKGWATALAERGPEAFYGSGFADYLPGYLYVLWLIGWLNERLQFSPSTFEYVIKLPSVIADVASAYCYLLSLEEHRDGDTWGVRLLELQDQGFAPDATIADAGQGLRAGQALAMPTVPCRGDVFHALQDAQALLTFLENRAYAAIGVTLGLERKKARLRYRGQRTQGAALKLGRAKREEAQSVALATDVATLVRWLREDVLALAGPAYITRRELFDFIVAELRSRETLCPHRIGPVVRALTHQRDDLLAFAAIGHHQRIVTIHIAHRGVFAAHHHVDKLNISERQ